VRIAHPGTVEEAKTFSMQLKAEPLNFVREFGHPELKLFEAVAKQ